MFWSKKVNHVAMGNLNPQESLTLCRLPLLSPRKPCTSPRELFVPRWFLTLLRRWIHTFIGRHVMMVYLCVKKEQDIYWSLHFQERKLKEFSHHHLQTGTVPSRKINIFPFTIFRIVMKNGIFLNPSPDYFILQEEGPISKRKLKC